MYSSHMGPALFIDGKNTAYRSVFATKNSRSHPFVSWLRFTNVWINKFRPSSIHLFWDCPKNNVWRKKVLQEYKDNRDGGDTYESEISDKVGSIEHISKEIMPSMNTRIYARDGQEADDLIYSACRLLSPNKVIIISSDSDMIQIPWSMSGIKCYDPRVNQFMEMPTINPVIQKALMGDSTDNVAGYRGIGDVKSGNIARDYKVMAEFLGVRGDKEYRRNVALIDLSMNPARITNELYCLRILASDPVFDKSVIFEKIAELKIAGLNTEYSQLVMPLKDISQRADSIAVQI